MAYQKPRLRPTDPTLRRAAIFCDRPRRVRLKHTMRERRIQAEQGRALFRVLAERDGRRCLCCGATRRLTLDHIVPVSRGGKTVIENLQILCFICNQAKSDYVMDFREVRS